MSDLGVVTAAVLVGGLGTRLRPVVSDRPKALAQVAGRPFLDHLLEQLVAARIRDVVLCTGFMADHLRATYGETFGTLRLRYSAEPEPLGTAGALHNALPLLGAATTLVLNGDSYCDVDLDHLYARHAASCAVASMTLTEVPETDRFGRVETDAHDRVTSFVEKGGRGGPGWINAGIYFLERPILDAIPAGRAVSLEREILPAWIGRGLYGFSTSGRFIDIGTPETFAFAQGFFGGRAEGRT